MHEVGRKSHIFSVNLIALSGGWRGPAVHFVRVYIVLDPLPLRMEKKKANLFDQASPTRYVYWILH